MINPISGSTVESGWFMDFVSIPIPGQPNTVVSYGFITTTAVSQHITAYTELLLAENGIWVLFILGWVEGAVNDLGKTGPWGKGLPWNFTDFSDPKRPVAQIFDQQGKRLEVLLYYTEKSSSV